MAGIVALPQLGQELLPTFKERDFLMHWVTKPGTSQPEDARIITQAQQGAARRSRGAQLRLAHRAGVPDGRSRRHQLRRELDQHRPEAPTTTRRWRQVQEVVDGYPGLFRDVQTYLKERIERC